MENSDNEDADESVGDSPLSSIDADIEVVRDCAESPSTPGHRTVFDLVDDALADNVDDRVEIVYGDTGGYFGSVVRDPDDWHRIVVTIDREEIEAAADTPLDHWEFLAETMIHEAFMFWT